MLRIALVFIWGPVTHIYTYTGEEEYTNNHLYKYNNRETNIYLIPPSDSWWINNTKFGEVKLMMSVSLSLREEICQLKLWRHILKNNNTILDMWSHKMCINTNMLSNSCFTGSWVILIALVLSDKRGVDIETETPKSSSSQCSHQNPQVTSAVTRAIACNSGSALERETATCFLVFQAMREPLRKTQ
jgi:hypothetical protein